MNPLRHLHLRTRLSASGQTMTEYALILLAILVVVVTGYQTMDTTLKTSVQNVNGEL